MNLNDYHALRIQIGMDLHKNRGKVLKHLALNEGQWFDANALAKAVGISSDAGPGLGLPCQAKQIPGVIPHINHKLDKRSGVYLVENTGSQWRLKRKF